MFFRWVIWPAMALLILGMTAVAAERQIIGEFSDLEPGGALPAGWEQLTFRNIDRHTKYVLVRDQGRTVVRADSAVAASGLLHRFLTSAEEFPWLSWEWKIDHVLQKGDVHRKQGDDYPARVYVAFAFSAKDAGFWERLRHKTAQIFTDDELPGTVLNYIWANHAPPGTLVSNPYAEETKMIVLRSGDELAGQWLREQRNLRDDYRAAFGRNPPPIIGIAIMTDTDNTGETTGAYFGDILLKETP